MLAPVNFAEIALYKVVKTKTLRGYVSTLQNSRFWTFSEGAKRRKRDPGV